MISLIQWLFWGHLHKWKIIEELNMVEDNESYGRCYVLQCEKCGTISQKHVGMY